MENKNLPKNRKFWGKNMNLPKKANFWEKQEFAKK